MSPETVYIVGFLGVLLLSLSWHEAAHAWVADRLGDRTARELGRVTLNPIKHLDPFLSVILPAILIFLRLPVFGGGKPVPINPANFRTPRRDFMLVALAGPTSNIVLAIGAGLIWAALVWVEVVPADEVAGGFIPPSMLVVLDDLAAVFSGGGGIDSDWPTFLLGAMVMLNALLAVFNLLPVPPLDGSRVIGWLLPKSLARAWYGLDRYGIIILVVALVVFNAGRYIGPVLFSIVTEVFAAVDLLIDAKRYG